MAAAKTYLINVPLIYRENFAGFRTAGTVDNTLSRLCQHGTGEEQVAAGAALMAIAMPQKKLALNIFLSEMNQPKTSYFAGGVKQKTGIRNRLRNRKNQTVEKRA